MDDLFGGKPVFVNGKIEKITVSRVELIEFLDRIRNNPNTLVLYDKYEEDWKRTQKEVKKIQEANKDYENVVAFDPYRGEKLAETATVFSDENYQKSKENDLAVLELEKMFKDNDKVVVFNQSRRNK
ncbi:MAG: hypothetical protein Q4E39_01690 [bacterium]|nr:hypothetical protein [bacterium]